MGLNRGVSDQFSIFQRRWISKSPDPSADVIWKHLGTAITKGGTKIPCDRRKGSRLRGSDGLAEDVNRLVGFERSSFINVLMERSASPEKRVRRCSGDKAPG